MKKETWINLYLAWKVTKNWWREDIVNWFRNTNRGDLPEFDWFTYMWPCCISCDHWCYHWKNSHWNWVIEWWCEWKKEDQLTLFDKCMNAIENSDIVFAWIDDLTAYWTFAEIWYAYWLKKPIFIVFDSKLEWIDNLRFVTNMATFSLKDISALEWFNKYKEMMINYNFK